MWADYSATTRCITTGRSRTARHGSAGERCACSCAASTNTTVSNLHLSRRPPKRTDVPTIDPQSWKSRTALTARKQRFLTAVHTLQADADETDMPDAANQLK